MSNASEKSAPEDSKNTETSTVKKKGKMLGKRAKKMNEKQGQKLKKI